MLRIALLSSVLVLAACDGRPATTPRNGTCVPEGERFEDFYTCEGIDGPSGDVALEARARVDHDPETLADPDYAWATAQVGACSCLCCHRDGAEARVIWDWTWAGAWTDSATDPVLDRLVGRNLSDPDFLPTQIEPVDNHGFERVRGAGLPSTDADRLTAFIDRELARRAAR